MTCLKRQGYGVFFPTYLHQPKRGSPIDRYLFPGYGFLNHINPRQWQPVLSTPGVKGFASVANDRPLLMPRGVIENLIDICDGTRLADNAAVVVNPHMKELHPGDLARIMSGPWSGQTALISLQEHDRITLLISIFGRESPVVFYRHQLEAIT